ncbi:MAG: tetratricopeptide repeat protein [Clostridium sp.]|nr:tetratricopeptide repeat protein [Clostridium sp.]
MLSISPAQNVNNKKTSFGKKLQVLNSNSYVPIKARSVLEDRVFKSQADTAMKEGHFEKAIELYHKALAVNPDDIELHLSIAKTYNFNKQYNNAIFHLEKYVSLKPDDIENITLLGECYKKSGKFSQAIEKFNKALLIEPNYDYARRNLLDAQNLYNACLNPTKARQERYDAAINNLTEAVKIAKNYLPKGYMDDMKDMTVSFDKTSQMGGRSNIAQYEHNKRKISVTDEYTYASPKLVGAYLIHEFTHGKDNDPYTSIREEQDAYRVQAKYWVENVKDVYDPEMDYVADLYKQSAETLDKRVAEIYKLRDPGIPETSYNHPPNGKKAAAYGLSGLSDQPLKAYEIIV